MGLNTSSSYLLDTNTTNHHNVDGPTVGLTYINLDYIDYNFTNYLKFNFTIYFLKATTTDDYDY